MIFVPDPDATARLYICVIQIDSNKKRVRAGGN